TESQLGQSVASSGNLMMGQVISEVVSAFTLVRGTNHELTTADIGIMVSSVEDLDALCKGKNFNLPKTGCQVSVERQ
ncbi:MAG: hypothetical protein NDI94_06460, partial [Candidatus Woesearchaeota archaeon]|nr:hypothetical protein [Candidatus Woesearchaeota archaeon]